MSDTLDLLAALIRNACVNDGTPGSGGEARSVETIAGYLGTAGTVVEPHPGRQSAVYRVPGTVPGAPRLMLMGHTDVVPVNEAGWTRDPFGGEVADGFVWGRGAIDMLNLTAAMAVAFKPYLTGDLEPLPGDLVFLAVADEENAGGLGARLLVEERWDLVATDYLLTEIAYPPIETGAGLVYPVSVGEKGPFWTRLEAQGTPGHGSVPYGSDNALAPLALALAGLFATPSPASVSAEWAEFVAGLAPAEPLRSELLDPDRIDAAIARLAAGSPGFAAYVHACTHLTVSPNVARVGGKANVIPDRAVAEVDLRALPGQDRAAVDRHLRAAMGPAGERIRLVPVADHAANASPRGTPLWEAVVGAVDDLTGTGRVVPALMPATTDARFFRDRGVVAYGAGLFDRAVSFPDFLAMFHGNDERVSVESVELTARMLARLLERWRSAC
jgi:acetylornithine deacetylase/succinyl-diaminopimelate desuccinylase-like protein